jgi:site-specific DNA-methyltransferase (adenine-specific)
MEEINVMPITTNQELTNQSTEPVLVIVEEELKKLSKKQLFLKCKERGLTKYKSKNKNKIIEILTNPNNHVANYRDRILNLSSATTHTLDIQNICGLEYLKTINNNSIDLILTDPPCIISKDKDRDSGMNNIHYNDDNIMYLKTEKEWEEYKLQNNLDADTHKEKYMKYGSIYGKKYSVKTTQSGNQYNEFNMETLNQFICEYYKKLKKGGTLIMFFDLWKITELKHILELHKFKQIRFIEWIKPNQQTRNSNVNYITNCREIALIGVKESSPTFNSSYENDNGIYMFPVDGCGTTLSRIRLHPNQKSLNLFEELIKKHSNENDTVLDTFLGSGTTAFACKNTNRHFKGCEISEKYYTKIMELLV